MLSISLSSLTFKPSRSFVDISDTFRHLEEVAVNILRDWKEDRTGLWTGLHLDRGKTWLDKCEPSREMGRVCSIIVSNDRSRTMSEIRMRMSTEEEMPSADSFLSFSHKVHVDSSNLD